MNISIRAITIALATALPFWGAAQQSFFTKAADSMLQHIDQTQVTSGYLYDRAFPLSEFPSFNHNTDTSTAEYSLQAYLELYQAAYQPQRMTKPETLNRLTRYLNAQNIIPIQVLDYYYQQIKPTAIQDGLLNYQSGVLTNMPGNISPFITKRLQLCTPLAQTIKSNTVTLSLMPHFISRNTGLNVTRVEISGAGFNKTLMAPVDSVTITFPVMGKQHLLLKTWLSDGSYFITKNEIHIVDDINTGYGKAIWDQARFIADPACRSEQFTGNIPWQGYEDKRAMTGKFDLDIYYRQGTSCNGMEQQLKNPVILIDGYDPTDKRNSKNQVLYTKFLRYVDDVTNPGSPADIDFVREIRKRGFDVILVDIPTYFYTLTGSAIPLDSNAQQPPPGYTFLDGDLIHGGGDYVERNALTMVSLLQYIQGKIGANDSIVLIGPSMGGQITRYALKYMEDRGLPHKVRLWVSQDSNHEGAVVPIGEQMMIAKLAQIINKVKTTRDQQLLSPANRQFVINHYYYNDSLNTEQVGGYPGFFDRYQHVIDSIGWPQQCRKIATISGAENGAKLNIPDAGQLALQLKFRLGSLNFGTSFWQELATLIFGVPCDLFSSTNCRLLETTLFTEPAPNQRGMVAQVKIPLFGVDLKSYVIGEKRFTRNQSLEVVQSGYYWAYKELVEQLKSFELPSFLQTAISITMPAGYNPIQPTGSTLAYGKGTKPNVYNGYHPKWDDDVTPFNLSCDKYIPFDAYMGPKTFSVLHDSIFYNQAQVLISEIRGIIPNYPKPDKTVFLKKSDAAKYYFCPGETLNFFMESNYIDAAALAPSWTVNTDKLQIVSGQGTPVVSVKYLGGLTSDEFQALGGLHISVNGESPCYKLQPAEEMVMGAGDIWDGKVTSVASGQGFTLQFGNAVNMSDRANIRIIAGLTYKENNLQNYTLVQNTYNTAMLWNTTPVSFRGRQENQLNISSNTMGQYLYRVNDANRCQSFTNSFTMNFARQLQFRLSPNPVKDEIIIEKILPENGIEFSKPERFRITIIDFFSQQPVLERQLVNSANIYMLPVKHLRNGAYVVRIEYDKEVFTEKIMVSK